MAMYEFVARTSDELSVKPGDVVWVGCDLSNVDWLFQSTVNNSQKQYCSVVFKYLNVCSKQVIKKNNYIKTHGIHPKKGQYLKTFTFR